MKRAPVPFPFPLAPVPFDLDPGPWGLSFPISSPTQSGPHGAGRNGSRAYQYRTKEQATPRDCGLSHSGGNSQSFKQMEACPPLGLQLKVFPFGLSGAGVQGPDKAQLPETKRSLPGDSLLKFLVVFVVVVFCFLLNNAYQEFLALNPQGSNLWLW